MKKTVFTFLFTFITVFPVALQACDWRTGERQQRVYLSWDGSRLTDWVVEPGAIKSIELPNGFALGIMMDEPETEKYQEWHQNMEHVPEFISITLYDMSQSEPVYLTRTYGGTNSIQGYGARGGADTVTALGDPGISMVLLKSICHQPQIIEVAQ